MTNPMGTRDTLSTAHIRRSASVVETAVAKHAYFGICDYCPRPIRAELPDDRTYGEKWFRVYCPDCGHPTKGERLFAVYTELDCDRTCLSAWGAQCSCGCSGVNHGKHWGLKLSESEMLASELDRYREHRSAVETRREATNLLAKAAAAARREIAGIPVGATESQVTQLRELFRTRKVPREDKVTLDGQDYTLLEIEELVEEQRGTELLYHLGKWWLIFDGSGRGPYETKGEAEARRQSLVTCAAAADAIAALVDAPTLEGDGPSW